MRRCATTQSAQPRPRLLIVVTLAERGGVVSVLTTLVPGLVDDFEVTVAAYGPGPLPEAVRAAGARYVPLRHVRRPVSPLRDLLGLAELVRLCRRVRPHVVHAHSTKAGMLGRMAAWLTRVPVRVFTAHGWAFATHPGRLALVYLWCDRLMRPLTTTTICVSRSEVRRGLGAGVCSEARTVTIPNGIELEVPRASPGDSGPPLRVLSVGRLAAPKDFVTLVHALGRLPDGSVRTEICGDGPDRELVEHAIAERAPGAHVELLGDRSDVAERLAAADVFVLSTRSEGMPISVLEAMAAGVPVVACAVGGVPELVVDGETGLLVTPGDDAALADALRRLVDDPALGRRMGAAGRERAERHHSLAGVRRRHAELYRTELAARGLP